VTARVLQERRFGRATAPPRPSPAGLHSTGLSASEGGSRGHDSRCGWRGLCRWGSGLGTLRTGTLYQSRVTGAFAPALRRCSSRFHSTRETVHENTIKDKRPTINPMILPHTLGPKKYSVTSTPAKQNTIVRIRFIKFNLMATFWGL
jgi:hypothetical protein